MPTGEMDHDVVEVGMVDRFKLVDDHGPPPRTEVICTGDTVSGRHLSRSRSCRSRESIEAFVGSVRDLVAIDVTAKLT